MCVSESYVNAAIAHENAINLFFFSESNLFAKNRLLMLDYDMKAMDFSDENLFSW